ncbi:hypothetical protein [Streptomyces sp. MC1]|nr:hypothetical protein [Streptomyces sp. MC1]
MSALLLWPLALIELGPRITARALAAAHWAVTRRTPPMTCERH